MNYLLTRKHQKALFYSSKNINLFQKKLNNHKTNKALDIRFLLSQASPQCPSMHREYPLSSLFFYISLVSTNYTDLCEK